MLLRYYVAVDLWFCEVSETNGSYVLAFHQARHAQNSMAPNTLRGGLQKNPEDAPEERHPLPGCEEQLSRKREKK